MTRTGIEPVVAGLKVPLPHQRSARRFGRLFLLLGLPAMEPALGVGPSTRTLRVFAVPGTAGIKQVGPSQRSSGQPCPGSRARGSTWLQELDSNQR